MSVPADEIHLEPRIEVRAARPGSTMKVSGRWRIAEMELWDAEPIDLLEAVDCHRPPK
jgi:hypothetical protein